MRRRSQSVVDVRRCQKPLQISIFSISGYHECSPLFTRLLHGCKLLKEGVVLRVTNVLVDGDTAAVELESLSTALNGKPFNNRYCWVARFSNGNIVEVRAYLDSALVQQLIDENERSSSTM